MGNDTQLLEAARVSKAWPFEEARKLLARVEARGGDAPVLFETGYGASGLPHIGTFAEVARTTMVRRAFALLSGRPTRLVAFSDDMDGLRKVPDNVPQPEMLREHLGRPVTSVPDPFGCHESFGHHNNAELQAFLDAFGFEYAFLSATQCYREGRFDAVLRRVLERYDAIMEVMLPTLGPERRATYSPFLPVSPADGRVLQVAILERDAQAGTIGFDDPATGERVSVPVTGGHAKLQWKVDWAMRWVALGVDYEMSGKDLIDSVAASSRIARILGGEAPEGFTYELFLDEKGEKISKSKGNGLSIEEWLRYGSPDSLATFMYASPRKAKRLHFDVIPRAMDDYWGFVEAYPSQPTEQQLGNPAFHVHGGPPPRAVPPVSFSLLLNLVTAARATSKEVLWGYVGRYLGVEPGEHEGLDAMMDGALAYARDFVAPTLKRRPPVDGERAGLEELDRRLAGLEEGAEPERIQYEVYEAGKAVGFEPLRDWFKALYETLLGASQGPRMGSFIALYGIPETRALIREALA